MSTYGRTLRWHIVMWVAHLLRVQLYAHWSEAPQDDASNWSTLLCSKPHCHADATVNMSGASFCDLHERAIRAERLRTGCIGTVLEYEGMGGKKQR